MEEIADKKLCCQMSCSNVMASYESLASRFGIYDGVAMSCKLRKCDNLTQSIRERDG